MATEEEYVLVDSTINTVQDSNVEKPLNIERPSKLMKTTHYYGRGQRSNSIGITATGQLFISSSCLIV